MKCHFYYFLLGVLVIETACHSDKAVKDTTVTVKTEAVKNYQDELYITYPGKVKPASDVNLSFRIAGPILRIPAEVGAFVRKGQLIAEIDPRDYEIQFSATEAEYKQVKGEAERVIELYKRNSIPVNDYDKAVSGLQQMTAKYKAHQNALQDTRMLAPFDGYIQKKYFDVHETVSAGIPVISMIDNSYFEVEIAIPSSDYVRQQYFKAFSCTFDVFPGKTFPLEFIEITRKANLNQLYRMRLRLKPVSGVDIAAGMSVNVTIEYTPGEVTLTSVPVSALFEYEGEAAVWIYDARTGEIHRRTVKTVKFLKTGEAVIYEGLKAGEVIVSAGVHSLNEGMRVKMLKPLSKTNMGGLL